LGKISPPQKGGWERRRRGAKKEVSVCVKKGGLDGSWEKKKRPSVRL